MIVNGTLVVKCENCGQEHDFDNNDADFEVTEIEEKELGQEKTYTWEIEFGCDSDECDNQIEIKCEVWEFPQSMLSHENVDVDGAILLEKYTYDLSEQPEPDDFE